MTDEQNEQEPTEPGELTPQELHRLRILQNARMILTQDDGPVRGDEVIAVAEWIFNPSPPLTINMVSTGSHLQDGEDALAQKVQERTRKYAAAWGEMLRQSNLFSKADEWYPTTEGFRVPATELRRGDVVTPGGDWVANTPMFDSRTNEIFADVLCPKDPEDTPLPVRWLATSTIPVYRRLIPGPEPAPTRL